MKQVRFLVHHAPYNGGEVAGFQDAQAAQLVAMKVAVYVAADPAPASASKDAPAKTAVREVSNVSLKAKASPAAAKPAPALEAVKPAAPAVAPVAAPPVAEVAKAPASAPEKPEAE